MDHYTTYDETIFRFQIQCHFPPEASPLRYSRGPFLEFPNRCGFGDGSEGVLGVVTVLTPGHRPQHEIDSFLQSWLYHGYLEEVFAIAELPIPFDIEHFVRTENSTRYIDTRKFPMYLRAWRMQDLYCKYYVENEQQYEQNKQLRFQKLRALVRALRHVVSVLLKPLSEEAMAAYGRCSNVPFLSDELAAAVGAIDAAITRTAISIWDLSMQELSDMHFVGPKVLLRRLRGLGWCPNDVTYLEEFGTYDVIYYFSTFLPYRAGRDHSVCTDSTCRAEIIGPNPGDYTTVHASATCQCTKIATVPEEDFIGPDMEEIVRWLDEKEGDAIPLVIFDPPSTMRVLHWEPNKPVDFVAFSHVWADGLGNRRSNSLPICQVQTLQKMANDVMAAGGSRSDQPTPFWIDTLCVPREPRSCRDIAIRRMAATYASAARVLVLDSEMRRGSRTASDLEISARLFISSWQRRLWTLQEGMLASKLFFQFRDGPLGLEDFHDKVIRDNHPHKLNRGRNFYSVAASYMTSGTVMTMRALEFDNVPERLLINVCTSLQYRTTSHAEDETICLANTTGIDPGELLRTPGNERMELFLRTTKRLPPDIIYLCGPQDRLKTDGFKWAPASLLSLNKAKTNTYDAALKNFYSRSVRLKVGRTPALASVEPTGGLNLSSPGFLLHDFTIGSIGPVFEIMYQERGGDNKVFVYSVWDPFGGSGEIPELTDEQKSRLRLGLVLSEDFAQAHEQMVICALVSLRPGSDIAHVRPEVDFVCRLAIRLAPGGALQAVDNQVRYVREDLNRPLVEAARTCEQWLVF